MNKKIIITSVIFIITALVVSVFILSKPNNKENSEDANPELYNEIPLSTPDVTGGKTLDQTLSQRRSRREYTGKSLKESEISKLAWSASGITDPVKGFRTAPSAGALYPLELYIALADVEGMEAGLYKYLTESHSLVLIKTGDLRPDIYEAGLKQQSIMESAAVFIYTAVFERTKRVYGERSTRYVYIEVGHSAQNLYLQCESLGLGTVAIGAFNDERLSEILELPAEEEPVYIMPVGR